MANEAELKLKLTAQDEASAKLKNVGLSLTDLNQGLELVNKGMQAAQSIYNATIGKALEYTETVRGMAVATGMTAEDTSRAIQVFDDYGVSADQLQVALAKAVKMGFEPSINGLGDLADSVTKMSDKTEQANLLSDMFGRSWYRVLPALAKGKDGFLEAANSVDDLLVVTQENIDKNRELFESLDKVSDHLNGLAIRIGNETVPALADLLDKMDEIDQANKKFGLGQGTVMVAAEKAGLVTQQYASAIHDLAEANRVLDGTNRVLGVSNSQQFWQQIELNKIYADNAMKTAELQRRYGDLAYSINGQLGPETKRYTDQQDELNQKIADAQAEIDKAIKQGYSPMGDKVKELKGKLAELRGEYSDNATAHEAATKKILYDIAAQEIATSNLAADVKQKMQEELAVSFGMIDNATVAATIGFQELQTAAIKAGDEGLPRLTGAMKLFSDAIAAGAGYAEAMQQALDYLNGKTFTATVIVNGIAGGGGTHYNDTSAPPGTTPRPHNPPPTPDPGQTFAGPGIGSSGGKGGGITMVNNFYNYTADTAYQAILAKLAELKRAGG